MATHGDLQVARPKGHDHLSRKRDANIHKQQQSLVAELARSSPTPQRQAVQPRKAPRQPDDPHATAHSVLWLGHRIVAVTAQARFLVWTSSHSCMQPRLVHSGDGLDRTWTGPTRAQATARTASNMQDPCPPDIWVHSSVVRVADCRSAGPWFKSGCALFVWRVTLSTTQCCAGNTSGNKK